MAGIRGKNHFLVRCIAVFLLLNTVLVIATSFYSSDELEVDSVSFSIEDGRDDSSESFSSHEKIATDLWEISPGGCSSPVEALLHSSLVTVLDHWKSVSRLELEELLRPLRPRGCT